MRDVTNGRPLNLNHIQTCRMKQSCLSFVGSVDKNSTRRGQWTDRSDPDAKKIPNVDKKIDIRYFSLKIASFCNPHLISSCLELVSVLRCVFGVAFTIFLLTSESKLFQRVKAISKSQSYFKITNSLIWKSIDDGTTCDIISISSISRV